MMFGAHLISSGRKYQSEADAVSIDQFPNIVYNHMVDFIDIVI